MSQDYVDLNAQQVANGLGQWDQVSETLESRWTELNGQIEGLLTPATWGSDDPGTSFEQSFVQEGKAGEFKERGQEVVTRVQETGQNVRTSVEASLGADQQQAAEVGGVNVPGFNSGGGGGGGGASSGGGGGGASSGGGGGASSGGGGGATMTSGGGGGGGGAAIAGETEAVFLNEGEYLIAPPGEGELMAEFVPGSGHAIVGDEMMTEVVPGSTQYVGEGELVAEAVDAGEVVSGQGEPVAEFIPETGQGAGQSELVGEVVHDGEVISPNGEPVAEFVPPQGQVSDQGAAQAQSMPYQTEQSSATQQPPSDTAGGGGAQGAPAGSERPAEGGAGRSTEGAAETIRERIAERIPDRVVEQLPDGIAERIYEARGDYSVDVSQPAVDVSSAGNPAGAVQTTGTPNVEYLPSSDEQTMEQPR